ncbi:MAG: hypothetical protein M1541_04565 [Acidobacteria bacterium]|nr:hypothetical protein [Acidobacteriota bacterium]
MKKLRKIGNRKSQIANRKFPLTPRDVDFYARLYTGALIDAEVLKGILLRACRQQGFRPKDAPKTKLLAGKLYEVLASRATRTDVDRDKVRELKNWLFKRDRVELLNSLFRSPEVIVVAPDADKLFAEPHLPRGLRERFERCLLHRSSRRLTVRKKKSVGASRNRGTAPAKRKAA